jgi:hypothetical protein
MPAIQQASEESLERMRFCRKPGIRGIPRIELLNSYVTDHWKRQKRDKKKIASHRDAKSRREYGERELEKKEKASADGADYTDEADIF